MYCKFCGKELPERALYCPHCGKRQSDAQAPNGSAQSGVGGPGAPNPNAGCGPGYGPGYGGYGPGGYGPYGPGYGPYRPYPYEPDIPSMGWGVLGFFFPMIGLILYLVWQQTMPLRARMCGKGALISVIVGAALVVFYILLLILLVGVFSVTY